MMLIVRSPPYAAIGLKIDFSEELTLVITKTQIFRNRTAPGMIRDENFKLFSLHASALKSQVLQKPSLIFSLRNIHSK